MNIQPTGPSTCLTALTATDDTPSPPVAATHLVNFIDQEFSVAITSWSPRSRAVVERIAIEVERICDRSDRIQTSGDIHHWQQSLARHRIHKCLSYYERGSHKGRVDLHSHLSAIAYRYVAPARSHLGFSGRCTLLEDFLQSFYMEALKAFRREHHLPATYTPQVQLELAEYLAFCEQYAKRKITLPGRRTQQLLILRAQNFAKRQPQETSVDIELAVDSPREDDADGYGRSPIVHQIREQMVADATDPSDQVLRDRIIRELIRYLKSQDQTDCIDYFLLRLQDLPAAEIDAILELSARQRDYLQQRFKYHIEKFAYAHHWELVHQWLGASLEQNLGLSESDWQTFLTQLTPEQQQLLTLKQAQGRSPDQTPADTTIARQLGCTPKQVQRRWVKLIEQAWQFRNQPSP